MSPILGKDPSANYYKNAVDQSGTCRIFFLQIVDGPRSCATVSQMLFPLNIRLEKHSGDHHLVLASDVGLDDWISRASPYWDSISAAGHCFASFALVMRRSVRLVVSSTYLRSMGGVVLHLLNRILVVSLASQLLILCDKLTVLCFARRKFDGVRFGLG